MEAHTYQSALKFAVGDLSYEEFIKQPQARAFEDDLLAIIKAIKKAKQDLEPSPQHKFNGTGAAGLRASEDKSLASRQRSDKTNLTDHLSLAHGYGKSIAIRGPCA